MIFISAPMGMNLRNCLIRSLNGEFCLSLAKNKIIFKKIMQRNNIPAPKTYYEIHNFSDLKKINDFPDEFVVKPNRGLGGHGILVLKREKDYFVDPSNDIHSQEELRIHLIKILDGEYSAFLDGDQVLIEERIYPSRKITFKDMAGLPDIRLFCYKYRPIMAMMRYSNKKSRGRANLSAGAAGIGIDIATGRFNHLHSKNEKIALSFNEFAIPADFVMPQWEKMKELAGRISELSGLGFSGVDLILNQNDEVMTLEINGRPGIEIQNINEKSLLDSMALVNAKPSLNAVK